MQSKRWVSEGIKRCVCVVHLCFGCRCDVKCVGCLSRVWMCVTLHCVYAHSQVNYHRCVFLTIRCHVNYFFLHLNIKFTNIQWNKEAISSPYSWYIPDFLSTYLYLSPLLSTHIPLLLKHRNVLCLDRLQIFGHCSGKDKCLSAERNKIRCNHRCSAKCLHTSINQFIKIMSLFLFCWFMKIRNERTGSLMHMPHDRSVSGLCGAKELCCMAHPLSLSPCFLCVSSVKLSSEC